MNNEINIVPELLVPAGDFDCVRAGVQNGADCIYFGANSFSANYIMQDSNNINSKCKNVIWYCSNYNGNKNS